MKVIRFCTVKLESSAQGGVDDKLASISETKSTIPLIVRFPRSFHQLSTFYVISYTHIGVHAIQRPHGLGWKL